MSIQCPSAYPTEDIGVTRKRGGNSLMFPTLSRNQKTTAMISLSAVPKIGAGKTSEAQEEEEEEVSGELKYGQYDHDISVYSVSSRSRENV